MKPNSFTEVRKLQSSSIIDLELDADSLDRFIRKGIHNIGEVIKKNEYGITVLKGRVSKGKECGQSMMIMEMRYREDCIEMENDIRY